MKHVVIIGSGLGGLSAALRLSSKGYKVTILEKHSSPGGRLNQIILDDFKFDMGPSFMSMTYELDELFTSTGNKNPLSLSRLDPLYQVFFEGNDKPYKIWKDLKKLEKEFEGIEPDLERKVENYLKRAAQFFHDTENKVVKSNFNGKLDYLMKLTSVPMKHLPYLFKDLWSEIENHFSSDQVRIIFSLVAFFLGSTPFQTPSIYSLLNYTELKHNGYWKIEGGMYKLVEELVKILKAKGVEIYPLTEVKQVHINDGKISHIADQNGKYWFADMFISNADAAAFRGQLLNRRKYSENNLNKMDWTLAPFTIYIGVKGRIDRLIHHNYFLGHNFKGYADSIFTSSIIPQKPYYYVNVSSKSVSDAAPEGCENLFILCPVPDMRYKNDWSDKELIADNIIKDLSQRVNFDIRTNTLVRKVLAPDDWAETLNLYKGSGLGLAHGMNQIGAFRPSNKDEKLKNLYYVGASTTPGTGLPMVIISSKLMMERMEHDRALQ